ncbi:MAG: hypothetical protein GY754_42735, partial [bacterium]|nr:hypothetical protein [bacterium]
EEEIERLDAALAATGVLTNGMVMPLNAVLIPDKDPRKKQLNLFAKDTAEGMILIDTSRGNFTYQYRGKWDEKESDSPREKLRKSFKASWDLYVKENRNAAGYIVINPPPHLRFKRKTWKAKSDGISTAQVWKERAQTIGVVTAIGVAALALVPEPSGATKVLAATLSVAGGIAGAASGGFNLYERWQRGNVYWDNATALDLSTIAGSIVAAGVNATAIRYASVGKSAALAKSGLGKAVCLGEGLNLGVEIGKFLVIKNDLFHKINKFNDLELQKKVRYSSWEKETIVENLLIQGISQGLVIVGSVASLKGHIKQAGHLPDSKPAFKPKRVYSSEKVFNKYGKEKFPGFEKVKFKKGGERITGDQKVPKGKKSGGSLKEFPHYRNGESIIKSSRTLTKKG